MAADEVVPHVGIRSHAGMVRLGMTLADVQPLLDRDRDIRVGYRGEPTVVAFVESPTGGRSRASTCSRQGPTR
jgi:hypothetical protein